MATGQTVIDRATSLIKVRKAGTSFVTSNATENADAFIALQEMLGEWGEDDVVQIPIPALVTTTLDIPAGQRRALAYNLAVEIAPDFGRVPLQTVFEIAKDTRDRLLNESTIDLRIDMSDLCFNRARYNINSDS